MKAPALARTSSLLGLGLLLLGPGCAEDELEQGELMLSITTDMAVPSDIDRLVLNITLAGETEPYARKVIELGSGVDFPVTLALEAGPRTKAAPITVRVEGRKGASPSLLRVAREARVVVPKKRVAKLELPLSWLCSGANLAAPCEAGSTCRAGHCVDSKVAVAALPDFEPAPARSCYDVTACLPTATLTSVGPITLNSGLEVPCGILGTRLLGADADVNLALEVTNERVGNYGFCGPFNECFVPLRRNDTPEGWRVLENGETPAIELPPIVCENSETSIRRVAIIDASPSCPSDQEDRPLCAPAQKNVCLTAQVCPKTSTEPAWAGYACNDAPPSDAHPDLLKCWSPSAADSGNSSSDDGRWCCLRGQHASDDPLLIDDMQAGPQIKLEPPQDHFAGWWFAEIPDGSGDLSPPPEPSLFTYRQFAEPQGALRGPKFNAAACLSSRGFHGWYALEGFYFATKNGTYGAAALDVSEYAGISFWGWSNEPFPDYPLSVEVNFPNVQTSTEPGSECLSAEDGPTRCESHFKAVTLGGEWKRYFVRWEELAQSEQDWGQIYFERFEPHIYAIYFGVRGAGREVMSQPFEFCIADIRFEQESPE